MTRKVGKRHARNVECLAYNVRWLTSRLKRRGFQCAKLEGKASAEYAFAKIQVWLGDKRVDPDSGTGLVVKVWVDVCAGVGVMMDVVDGGRVLGTLTNTGVNQFHESGDNLDNLVKALLALCGAS